MIWLDITDPKYVLFFKDFIPLLESLDRVVVTTRSSQGYSECLKLLDHFAIKAKRIGGYGGNTKLGKLQARLQRQQEFLDFFNSLKALPKLFITGASVEGVQTAYGLGIPIVNFADTPIAGNNFSLENITILSRLTLPLSTLIFRPFIVPSICYSSLGIKEEQIIAYNFIDVALWLKNLKAGEDFRKRLGLDCSIPTILVREEEYQAHYVKEKLPIIYESIDLLSKTMRVNIVIMPRYGDEELKNLFLGKKNVYILEEKLSPNEFYPYIDLLIGGGGTMNLESCYLGIPTISTRSLFLYHDLYLIENHLMRHAETAQKVLDYTQDFLQDFSPKYPRKLEFQTQVFEKEEAGFERILRIIKETFY